MSVAQARAGAQRLAAGGHSRVVGRARAGKISRALRRGGQAISLFRLEPCGDESAAAPQRVARDASARFEGHARRRAAVYRPARFQIVRRHPELRDEIHRAPAHALRHQKIRPATDVHHRRRRFSLQNVPRHRRARWCRSAWANFRRTKSRRMLAKKDRRVAGMTAPAHGLVLWKVFYSTEHAAADVRRLNKMKN